MTDPMRDGESSADFSRDEWTVHRYDGQFAPMAFGPGNISVDVNDDGTVTIEHEVPSDYFSTARITARVTIPRDWLDAMIVATEAYRESARDSGRKL